MFHSSKNIFKFLILVLICIPNQVQSQISLIKEISGKISPKSIVTNQAGLFAAQNMMYRHSITFYDENGLLIYTMKDQIDLNAFGFNEYSGVNYLGGPVEACFSKDDKFLWVSNYSMLGKGFEHEGCDACSGKKYDPSFLYKINTENFSIENIIKVGAVPKFLSISNNGRLLVVSNWSSSDISIIDLDKEIEIKRINVGLRPRGVVIDNRNQFAYVALMGGNRIAKVNLLTYQINYFNEIGKAPRHLIIDKSNSFLYVAVNSTNKLAKINLKTNQTKYCSVNSGPRSMVLSPDEKWLYVVNYYDDTFQKINTSTFEIEATINTKHHPIGITANWSTGEIWVACYVGVIQIFKDSDF